MIDSGKLKVLNRFITKENINNLISDAGFSAGEEIDLLSIDLDGNDYHIFSEINVVNPRVVVIEYNAKLPPDFEWSMQYKADFVWGKDDFFGASLKSMENLGNLKGYQLVGTNINGVNAFFVRKDLAGDLFLHPAAAENLYNPMRPTLEHLSGHYSREWLNNVTHKTQNKYLTYASMLQNSFITWIRRFLQYNRK